MKEKESLPFYHTSAWKRVRALAMQRDGGMCRECMRQFDAGYGFRPRRATMVHHIQPISERPDLALEISNLEALCEACHNKKHPEKGGGGTTKEAPRMRVIKV